MPRAYSLDLRERLWALVEGGMSARAAGRLLRVSESSAVKWVRQCRQTGSLAAKPMGGYKRSPLDRHGDLVLALIADQDDLSLAEIRQALAERGIRAGHASLWRFFKRHDITFKKNRTGERAGARRRGRGAAALATSASEPGSPASGLSG